MGDFAGHFAGMPKPRTSLLVSALLGLIGLALAALKAIFDVTVQDFWKDTATPYLRGRVGLWITTIFDWISPFWLGAMSSFISIMFAAMTFAWWNAQAKQDTPDEKEALSEGSNNASHHSPPTLEAATTRRVGKRADSLELIAVERSRDRVYILSHWRPDGTGQPRIRIDAAHLDGSVDASFGQAASGYTSFSLSGEGKAQAHRISALEDDSSLVVGSIFNEKSQKSTGFIAKLDDRGSLCTGFGVGGFIILERQGDMSYAHDSVVIGKNIYCVSNTYEHGDVFVHCFSPDGHFLNFNIFSVTADGTAWPNRVVKTSPENGMIIVGKLTSKDSARSDGFILKIGPNGELSKNFGSNGVVSLCEASSLPLIHQVHGAVVLPTGSVLVAGTGNEGFIVGLDSEGRPLLSFGKSGTYESQATYRTTATSLSYSPEIDAISLAGIESDGNSINQPFVNLVDSSGRSLLRHSKDPVKIDLDAHFFRSEHILLENGNAFLAMQEGSPSLPRRGIVISVLPLNSIRS